MLYESIECIERKIDADIRISQFVLYSDNLGGKLNIRKINLNSNPEGHKFRYVVEGWGVIFLKLGKIFYNRHFQRNQLETSCIGHNSEKRAQNWFPTIPELGNPDLWHWKAINQESRKIENMIKKLFIKENIVGTRLVSFIMPSANTLMKTLE